MALVSEAALPEPEDDHRIHAAFWIFGMALTIELIGFSVIVLAFFS